MSEQNLEQRVQLLEARVQCLEARALAVEKATVNLGRAVIHGKIADHQTAVFFLDLCDSNRDLKRMLIQLHPELETNDVIGQIHAGQTNAEFSRAKLQETIANMEAVLKLLPPESPDAPASPG
jgi:hypothetical protein